MPTAEVIEDLRPEVEEEGVEATPFLEHKQIVKWVQFGSLLLFLPLWLLSLAVLPSLGPSGCPNPHPGHPKEATSQNVLLPSPHPVKRLPAASVSGPVGTSLHVHRGISPSKWSL